MAVMDEVLQFMLKYMSEADTRSENIALQEGRCSLATQHKLIEPTTTASGSPRG